MGQGQSQQQQSSSPGGGGRTSSATPTNGTIITTPKYKKNNKCSPAKVKSCLRTFLAHLFSHVGLCVLIVGYTCLGALMFESFEYEQEQRQRNETVAGWESNFTQIRRKYVHDLWNITEQFNVLYEMNWTSAVEKELKKFEAEVAAQANRHRYDGINSSYETHWDFSGALLYSVSIITTIGYGNAAPSTEGGKIMTMFYAVLGVPLMLLWLSNIGNLMANTFKFVYTHYHARCLSTKNSRSVQSRRRQFSKEPSSIQVKYSVSAKTCETHVVQQQPQLKNLSRREQRAALRSLDSAAKQMLIECAEYNVNMDQDERSRRILHQLHSDANGGNSLTINGVDEGSSDEVESVIDMRGVVGGGCDTVDRRIHHDGGSVMGISVNGLEGTPSKVPLLLHKGGGGESGPDLVEVEGLEECRGRGGSDGSLSPSEEYDRAINDQRVPISLVLIFVVLYILGGAWLFSKLEQWPFLDGAYFCFITLSTIGLGDLVPGRSLKSADEGQAKLIGCVFYLVLGLAIIAMSFNLVQEEVAAKVKDFARRVGIIKDDEDR